MCARGTSNVSRRQSAKDRYPFRSYIRRSRSDLSMALISRGFRGRKQSADVAERLPPGQYETRDFPVLSAGPTPRISLASWDFALQGADGQRVRWTWDEFNALPHATVTPDIHCV